MDIKNVHQTLDLIHELELDCNIITNFSDVNLGLKNRFSSGMKFIFGETDQAIILEDDCLPTSNFFRFCDEMLEKYKNEKSISMVSGYNYHGTSFIKESYYFSMYSNIWGWATWKDRWTNYYDPKMSKYQQLKNDEKFLDVFLNNDQKNIMIKDFDKAYNGTLNTWDYQWTFANFINKRLSIVPKNNLVKNIGLGHKNATHTTRRYKSLSKTLNLKFFLKFPLKHPIEISQNKLLDIRENQKKIIDNSKISQIVYWYKKLRKLK